MLATITMIIITTDSKNLQRNWWKDTLTLFFDCGNGTLVMQKASKAGSFLGQYTLQFCLLSRISKFIWKTRRRGMKCSHSDLQKKGVLFCYLFFMTFMVVSSRDNLLKFPLLIKSFISLVAISLYNVVWQLCMHISISPTRQYTHRRWGTSWSHLCLGIGGSLWDNP